MLLKIFIFCFLLIVQSLQLGGVESIQVGTQETMELAIGDCLAELECSHVFDFKKYCFRLTAPYFHQDKKNFQKQESFYLSHVIEIPSPPPSFI